MYKSYMYVLYKIISDAAEQPKFESMVHSTTYVHIYVLMYIST